MPERLWQRRSHSLQQGSVVTPCPAVGPSVPFFVHVLFIFVEHRRRSPFFQVFPRSIHLLSASNNGSIGSIPQTTSKMIILSLCKDILFVVDLGQLEPFAGIIFDTTDSMCNVCIFRNVKEVLVRTLIHPPWWSYDSMCNMLKTKKTNPIPPFPQASFLKFATLPRDRKWHISKLATLPRAPYQPHASNYPTLSSKHWEAQTHQSHWQLMKDFYLGHLSRTISTELWLLRLKHHRRSPSFP